MRVLLLRNGRYADRALVIFSFSVAGIRSSQSRRIGLARNVQERGKRVPYFLFFCRRADPALLSPRQERMLQLIASRRSYGMCHASCMQVALNVCKSVLTRLVQRVTLGVHSSVHASSGEQNHLVASRTLFLCEKR